MPPLILFVNPIPVGGGGFFPTLKTFSILIYKAIFVVINPHRYVIKIYRSSLLWLEEKNLRQVT